MLEVSITVQFMVKKCQPGEGGMEILSVWLAGNYVTAVFNSRLERHYSCSDNNSLYLSLSSTEPEPGYKLQVRSRTKLDGREQIGFY